MPHPAVNAGGFEAWQGRGARPCAAIMVYKKRKTAIFFTTIPTVDCGTQQHFAKKRDIYLAPLPNSRFDRAAFIHGRAFLMLRLSAFVMKAANVYNREKKRKMARCLYAFSY